MKEIEAYLNGRKVYILGFAGGEGYVMGGTLKHTIFAVYYDPEHSTDKLQYCTIDCLVIKETK